MASADDTFYTIDSISIGEYKSKGSKFTCYLVPCLTIEEFQEHLNRIKKQHPKSRHHCYAYRMGYQGELLRINDDGEPSGTAGKPIYGQLLKNDLVNVGGIIVRYFGGTKLGTSGLISAYKGATEDAVYQAKILKKVRKGEISISFDYGLMGKVMKILKTLKLTIKSTSFDANPSLIISCPYSELESKIILFKAEFLGRAIADIQGAENLQGVMIEIAES